MQSTGICKHLLSEALSHLPGPFLDDASLLAKVRASIDYALSLMTACDGDTFKAMTSRMELAAKICTSLCHVKKETPENLLDYSMLPSDVKLDELLSGNQLNIEQEVTRAKGHPNMADYIKKINAEAGSFVFGVPDPGEDLRHWVKYLRDGPLRGQQSMREASSETKADEDTLGLDYNKLPSESEFEVMMTNEQFDLAKEVEIAKNHPKMSEYYKHLGAGSDYIFGDSSKSPADDMRGWLKFLCQHRQTEEAAVSLDYGELPTENVLQDMLADDRLDLTQELERAKQHPKMEAYLHYLKEELGVDDDYLFGDAEGDPAEDLCGWVRFLRGGPDEHAQPSMHEASSEAKANEDTLGLDYNKLPSESEFEVMMTNEQFDLAKEVEIAKNHPKMSEYYKHLGAGSDYIFGDESPADDMRGWLKFLCEGAAALGVCELFGFDRTTVPYHIIVNLKLLVEIVHYKSRQVPT